MNKEIKALWIDALRSGEYEQGKGLLATVEGQYCCLGVLCELAVKAGVIEEGKPVNGDSNCCERCRTERLDYEGTQTLLPGAVGFWADIDSAGRFPSGETVYHTLDGFTESLSALTEANDAGMPFSEIADLIEKHF